jgi:ketosteroid isomerase-like protein
MVLGVRTKRATFVATIALCGVLVTMPGPLCAFGWQPSHKKHDEKKEVEKLEEQWRVATLAVDIPAMDKMLADDYIGISMSGQVNTKAQQLERMRTRKLVLTKLELSDMKVKLVGTVAIVTSVADIEGTNEGTPVQGKYRYTRVYQHIPSGGWKITSFEATRILPPRAERTNEQQHKIEPTPGEAVQASQPHFG